MPKQRLRGACLQCARRKRKCDHKQPQCSQCLKHGQICDLQTFKVSTPLVFNSRQAAGGSPSTSQLSQRGLDVTESRASTGTQDLPQPPESHHDEGLVLETGLPTLDIVPRVTNFTTLPDSSLLEALLAPPGAESPCSSGGFVGPDDTCAGAFPGSNHAALADPGADEDPDEIINTSAAVSLLSQNIDNGVFEFAPSTDIMPSAAELLSSMGSMDESAFLEPFPDLPFDSLYCPMPWPADMLVSSERRFLWQYFLNIAEADFLCLDWEDVGHLYGFQHPYITTLPQMALSNDALRAAIFCFAASQYELRHGRPEFETTKRLASSEAARAISTQMTQGTDNNNLLSMVSAATMLHHFGTERHDYLRVAARLVSKYLARPKPSSDTSTPFPEIPLTEFRWSVISTLCSLHQPSAPLGARVCRMIEMGETEIKQNYSNAFRRWISHPIYSFSPRLVNPLLRIGRLLETQLLQLESADEPPDPSWAARVTEAEELLLQAWDSDMSTAKSALGSADPAAVLALNESMYAAGAILLYARIHGLPATAPFIRRQTQIVTEEIAKIPADSHVSFAIVFPLFIAGCEAVELQMRNAIIERLREPGGVTFIRGDLAGALNHIWEIRDLEPGLSWPHWVQKVESPYRISCLM